MPRRKRKKHPRHVSIFEKDVLHAHLLSFGLGVQSTAMVLKVLEGAIPKPDGIIFADPHYEHAGSYENLERIKPMIQKAGIPLHVVSAGNLREDQIFEGRTELPYYANGSRYETIEGKLQLYLSDVQKAFYKEKRTENRTGQISLFEVEADLEKVLHDAATQFGKKVQRGEIKSGWVAQTTTQIGRQCTMKYKIKPTTDFAREHYGANLKSPVGQWLGISTDEWTRMTVSPIKAVRLMYPLIELNMSRTDCEVYLAEQGYPIPPKSACLACPYHSNDTWKSLNAEEFLDVVEFEESVIQMIAKSDLKYKPYFANGIRLHNSMIPMEERPFDTGISIEDGSPCVGSAGCFL